MTLDSVRAILMSTLIVGSCSKATPRATPLDDFSSVTRSVGLVVCRRDRPPFFGGGSGFVLSDRYIVTNHHVVQIDAGVPCERIEIYFPQHPERAIPARLVADDPIVDLAVLDMGVGPHPPPLELAPTEEVRDARSLLVIGYPAIAQVNQILSKTPKISRGVVSAVEVQEAVGRRRVVQTDAAINPGNSGGPAVDLCGRVVGVSTFRARGHNVSWLLHVDEVRQLAKTRNLAIRQGFGDCGPPPPMAPYLGGAALALSTGALVLAFAFRRPLKVAVDRTRGALSRGRMGPLGASPLVSPLALPFPAGPAPSNPFPPTPARVAQGPLPGPGMAMPRAPAISPTAPTGGAPLVAGPLPPAPWPPPPPAPPQPGSSSLPSASLHFVSGPLAGQTLAIEDGETLTMGRDPSCCSIVFAAETPTVSKRHASIRRSGSRYMVWDHSSRAGTFLSDGRRVASESWCEIRGGEVLHLGQSNIRFRVG